MNEQKSREKYKRLIKLLFSSVLMAGLGAIYAVFWVGYYNRYILQTPFFRRGNWVIVLMYIVLLAFFMYTYGGFKIGYLKNTNLIYSQGISVFFSNFFVYFQIAVLDKRFVSPIYIILMTFIDIVLIFTWTILFHFVYRHIFPPRKMLLITGDYHDYHLKNNIKSREDKYEICELVSYKEDFEAIENLISRYDGVIVGDMPSHERNQIIKYCFQNGKRSYSVPKISDILLRSSDELNLFDSPLLLSRNLGLSIEQQCIKRCEDIIISIIMLILFSPVFLLACIGIKLTDRGPIFYKQERLTRDGKLFMIYKFRTMVVDAEVKSGPILASEKDPRIHTMGKLLRSTRMDELPQIINILKGDMSVVGPRPERPEIVGEIVKEIPEFDYRLKVKAGLTGYAQIYGKYSTTAYDKLKLDLTYIRYYSIFLDLKLIIMTPKIMFMKESTEGIVK
ncbi:exopolysaccharide biosynthesis polyprenyl glycosylphosphotransferase [Lacrimispora algidixylanolytica]|uniref:Exopolysaccharide biosynthesis polyprenyl glycosylphosphotransferase n=1 Tax=Lacrimispora algidixylanolytica TaxID=94868 RepID=A0A419TBL7_9FIRM|nr:exopolysaccharide biosynthesis polyprenyl glycosylphosphotransferase [Lacrimispora algidixylanolytica]RKD34847.1 exopolysaccharide biosynthesis polyprenyl glycosylphosphotransferase [Lacrimispora algidixylanolytica]